MWISRSSCPERSAMWWRRGATQQTLTAMIAQRDQRQGQQVSRILAPVVFSNKTQKSAPSEVSKVSITARDFSLNKTKTLEKILESTAIKNWELHHANIKGTKIKKSSHVKQVKRINISTEANNNNNNKSTSQTNQHFNRNKQ